MNRLIALQILALSLFPGTGWIPESRKLLAALALWFIIIPFCPAQVQMDRVNVKGINSIISADFMGSGDCGSKINAADVKLGVAAGEIWVSQLCGLTISTAVTLSAKHVIRFIQGGTYTVSAVITLGANSCIFGPPGSWTDDDTTIPEMAVILKQANNANLANFVLGPNSEGCLQDIALDGNRANNTTTNGIKATGLRFHTDRVVVAEFPGDGVQVNSTGSTNNAGGAFLDRLASIRNTGKGLNCTGSADMRVFHGFFEFNGSTGIQLTNCNSPFIKFNEISSNQPGIAATGSSTANILTGSYPGINMNSLANNICASAGRGADIDINGFDGSVGGQVPDAQIIGNRLVGSNATSNTCDSIHLQDTANTIISNNVCSSTASNTYRYCIGIFSVSATEGRDHVSVNDLLGTIGTAFKIGTTQTVFQSNNENGTGSFEEFDTANLFIPNAQAWNAKNPAGSVFGALTMSNGGGDWVQTCGTAGCSSYIESNGTITGQFAPTQLVLPVLGYTISLKGATSGTTTLQAPGTGGVTSTFPTIAGTLAVSGNGGSSLIQAKRAVAGCTTGAAAGNSCASDITVTWATAFADANYSVSCSGNTPTNVPSGPFMVSATKLAASVHINYFAITAAAASYATIDCIAQHD